MCAADYDAATVITTRLVTPHFILRAPSVFPADSLRRTGEDLEGALALYNDTFKAQIIPSGIKACITFTDVCCTINATTVQLDARRFMKYTHAAKLVIFREVFHMLQFSLGMPLLAKGMGNWFLEATAIWAALTFTRDAPQDIHYVTSADAESLTAPFTSPMMGSLLAAGPKAAAFFLFLEAYCYKANLNFPSVMHLIFSSYRDNFPNPRMDNSSFIAQIEIAVRLCLGKNYTFTELIAAFAAGLGGNYFGCTPFDRIDGKPRQMYGKIQDVENNYQSVSTIFNAYSRKVVKKELAQVERHELQPLSKYGYCVAMVTFQPGVLEGGQLWKTVSLLEMKVAGNAGQQYYSLFAMPAHLPKMTWPKSYNSAALNELEMQVMDRNGHQVIYAFASGEDDVSVEMLAYYYSVPNFLRGNIDLSKRAAIFNTLQPC